ncbi:MAG: type I restriction enzyme HsdR N-terminal domain-containing protein [Gammaproteobacteria bacterium]|nr:type I restriction enzyme HsdR N-terminal domain-containing protein [Gammaproteobacteria bacterium]
MVENFLPADRPAIMGGVLRCEVRDKAVPATPEECVRQRVLRWLMRDRGWPKESLRLEKSYRWVGDANRHHVRPDIELLVDGNVLVVVECKRPDVPLGERVDRQAIDYAVKSGAGWIWTTNGDSHGFLSMSPDGWIAVRSLEPLEVLADPPVADLAFPADATDESEVARYWRSLGDEQFLDGGADYNRQLLLDAHCVLFGLSRDGKLPYSHGGVHILEDRGSAWHQFGNRSGRSYHTRYADFIAATAGSVEAVSLAVNRWYPGLRLCVGVTRRNRAHHALQLNCENCVPNEAGASWSIYHDGAMSQVARTDVLEAVREAGAGAWIDRWDDGKDWVYLGELPYAATADWTNSCELLANLIHYGIIRSNLREAVASR